MKRIKCLMLFFFLFIFILCSNKTVEISNISCKEINSYGIVIKNIAPVYNKISGANKIVKNMNLSDIFYIDSSYNDFYRIRESENFIPKSSVFLVDSVLYQKYLTTIGFYNTIHDIFNIKSDNYVPIYAIIFNPYIKSNDYDLKKHLAKDIKIIWGDEIQIDNMPYLKSEGNLNLGCIDNKNKKYIFFLLKI